jgi:hypothetical protein
LLFAGFRSRRTIPCSFVSSRPSAAFDRNDIFL